jgi:hypothetical protein
VENITERTMRFFQKKISRKYSRKKEKKIPEKSGEYS